MVGLSAGVSFGTPAAGWVVLAADSTKITVAAITLIIGNNKEEPSFNPFQKQGNVLGNLVT